MAAEFHYSRRALNEGVKQFIAEMREGLEKQNAQMSQIPTYVTSVPNGTEKVSFACIHPVFAHTYVHRVLSWLLTSVARTSAFVPSLFMGIIPSL